MGAPLYDKCECPCHLGSIVDREFPDVSDPVASLSACSRCAVLHAGVWTVVERPTKPTHPWDNGEGDE